MLASLPIIALVLAGCGNTPLTVSDSIRDCNDVKGDNGFAKVQVGKAGRLSAQIFCNPKPELQILSYVSPSTECPDSDLTHTIKKEIGKVCDPAILA